ncbi:MAG: hypothetical protein ACRBCL_14305 [Maritimibacter sp.]
MNRLFSALFCAATVFPLAAHAADFQAPKGCETFLTVQSRQCAVSNLYRCDKATDGSFWEVVYSGNGLESIVEYDGDYQWMNAYYAWDNANEIFKAPAEDRISRRDLMHEGIDTFRFDMHRTAPGEDRVITIVGADQLTDRTTVIDDVALEAVSTQLRILSADGEVEYHARGVQFLSREYELFFLGTEEVFEADGSATVYDSSPVEFINPGEPGFGSTLPYFECEEQKAGLVPVAPDLGQKEIFHDQI